MATLAEVLDILGPMYWAPERVKQTLIKSRVQNMQRLGIPTGARPGKGARVDYGPDEICQIAFAFELGELGLGPAHIEVVLRGFWHVIGPVFAGEWKTASPEDEPTRLFVITRAVSCQWESPVSMRIEGVGDVTETNPIEYIKDIKYKGADWDIILSMMDQKRGNRFTIFNVSKIVRQIKERMP